jgi:hypothetical protein
MSGTYFVKLFIYCSYKISPLLSIQSVDYRLAKIMISGLRKFPIIVLLSGLVIVNHGIADTGTVRHSLAVPDIQSCPSSFFDVAVVSGARQCQQFDDSLPASLVYFTKHPPEEVIHFYQTTYPQFVTEPAINQRTMLIASNDSVRIVISPDKMGTQVDVLIVSKP